MPNALRWLWHDYPQPIAKPAPNGTGNRSIAILDPKSEWEAVPPDSFRMRTDFGTVTRHAGRSYSASAQDHAVVYRDPSGKLHRTKLEGLTAPSGVALSPDESLLYVSDKSIKWVWSFQVQVDGSLQHVEPFFRLETLDETSRTDAAGMAVDTEGYLYVATNLGIQVCDQPGRVVAIINPPADGPLLGVAFGGKDFDYLYVDQGDKLYRRHMLRKGIPPGTVLKPPTPRL
jgi:gluconolactonase